MCLRLCFCFVIVICSVDFELFGIFDNKQKYSETTSETPSETTSETTSRKRYEKYVEKQRLLSKTEAVK